MIEVEVVRIPVASDAMAPLVAVLHDARAAYLAPPACRSVELFAPREGGILIAMLRWSSAAAHAAALESRDAKIFFARVSELSSAPPAIERMHELARSGALAGQVVLLTGGASGIGRAIVDRFVAEGAHIVVVDRNAAGLAALAEAHGEAVTVIEADITTAGGNEAAVRATIERHGRLDTLILNAGLFDGFTDFKSLTAAEVDLGFDAIFDVNVRGPMLAVTVALPHLVTSRGSIILTLSNASLAPDGGGVFYVASKHAGLGLMRQLAHELAPCVRVNAVAPGATRTSIGVPAVFGAGLNQQSDEVSAAVAKLVPLRRHSEPSDHAGAYVLLASRTDASYMTGSVVVSDGGLDVRGLRRVCGGDDLSEHFRR